MVKTARLVNFVVLSLMGSEAGGGRVNLASDNVYG